ncbi:MAG: cupredoxin domain-containing protein [Candidatus Pacebacteria bacterium]|nr:cupredoxin domain-containing protein [Candidatus Paceibacterota bacterium]
MENMQIIGLFLILFVLIFYIYWIRFTQKQVGAKAKEDDGVQAFDVIVKGVYSPNVISAKVGKPVRINFLRQENSECSRFVIFSDFNIRKELPENETVSIEFTPEKAGEYLFTCDMGMYQGKLIVK